MLSKSATQIGELNASNNVGIECHSCSTFGEHLGTHTPGILGQQFYVDI